MLFRLWTLCLLVSIGVLVFLPKEAEAQCPDGYELTDSQPIYQCRLLNNVAQKREQLKKFCKKIRPPSIGDIVIIISTIIDWINSRDCAATSSTGTTSPTTSSTSSSGPSPSGRVAGDPMFVGFDQKIYYFQGETDKTFCLVSEPEVVLNARFKPLNHSFDPPERHAELGTVLGPTCLRVCNTTVVFLPNQTVFVNGEALGRNAEHSAGAVHVSVEYAGWQTVAQVTVDGRWKFEFRMRHDRIDIPHVIPLFERNVKMHGVLGHTWYGAARNLAMCNTPSEGGCEVEGNYREYVVPGDDICSPAFAHSQFEPICTIP